MFKLLKIENGRINVPEPEMLTLGADMSEGTVCVISGGVLTLAGATAKPTHVTLGAGKSGEAVSCGRITPDHVFEVPISVAPTTSCKIGVKLTTANGTQVTATTTDGVATIVSLNGASVAGDKVLVRFE